jgi:hypothetical protein
VTEQRIRELARDLEPVRPIPRLRTAGAGILAAWAALVFVDWLAGGWAPRGPSDSAWVTPSYLGALAGVALVAFGATSAALASAVPGRGAALRVGLRVTALGAALALAGWAVGASLGPADHGGEDLRSILGCAAHAFGLGLVPALLACAFAAFAALRRARVTAALALAGGVALGAVAVHASCRSNSALHQLVAHTLAPAAAVILLTAPLAPLLGRWARRD